jgi:hypothetical protein
LFTGRPIKFIKMALKGQERSTKGKPPSLSEKFGISEWIKRKDKIELPI